MENQTELNEIESQEETNVETLEQEKTLNNEPEIIEPEPVPEPWANAPDNMIYPEKINDNGRLGSYTLSAEMAYRLGTFENGIPLSEVEFSDVDDWPYLKPKCPHKTQEQIQQELAEQRFEDIQTAVQAVLDKKANEKNYDNGFAVASYALSTNDTFRSEAGKFIAWRDAVWAKCYQILDAYKAGEIEMPSVENVIAVLPELEWDDE